MKHPLAENYQRYFNQNLSENKEDIVDVASELESRIWNSNNRQAQREWEEVNPLDNNHETPNYDFDDYDEEEYDNDYDDGPQYWDDLDPSEIEQAILDANAIIAKYNIK